MQATAGCAIKEQQQYQEVAILPLKPRESGFLGIIITFFVL
jgi:hypothetical protein